MNGKELAKYAAAFGAGVFAVLGVIGFNSLIQPAPEVLPPQAVAEKVPTETTDSESAISPDQAQVSETPIQPRQPSSSSTSQNQNTFTSNLPSATQQIGAGVLVSGVSSIGNLARNTMVTIQGEVTRINDEDEFVITDATGSVQVYTGRSLFIVEQGQQVSVRGLVDDGAFLEVYASEVTLPDGTVVQIRHWN